MTYRGKCAWRIALLVAAALPCAGCASLVGKATSGLSRDLTAGIVNQDDPETVAEGLPAYLLLLDGLIEGDPQNAGMLLAASKLYGAYAGSFVTEPVRRARLARKSLVYARRATCIEAAKLCGAIDGPYEGFAAAVAEVPDDKVALLHGLGSAWAGAIQAEAENLDRIAELPQVEAVFRRVVAQDPDYDTGSGFMYLGVLSALRPASLGGKPDAAKADFEQAIARSGGRNQMARVLYAEYYARLVFDQALHDRLLNEVVAADPAAPGLTLSNVIAQRRARELLESGKDYF